MPHLTRIKRSQELIEDPKQALLIEKPIDLYYLTGMEMTAGMLVISQDDCVLFADGRYYETCAQTAPCQVNLFKGNSLYDFLEKFSSIAIDANETTVARLGELKAKVKAATITPWTNPIGQIRQVKDSKELEKLKKAAALGSRGFEYICGRLRTGVSEKDLATELELFCLKEGAEGMGFPSIIAFGENSSKPHYTPSPHRKLQAGDTVLIDMGVCLDHYNSDMTRTVFFQSAQERMEIIYAVVLEAQERAIAGCKAGITASELDAIARQFIDDQGYGKEFQHGLGHGIGLEVHEGPFLKSHVGQEIQSHTALTIEPGIYLPGLGGVRIEDTVIVEEQGCLNLSSPSKNLRIITD